MKTIPFLICLVANILILNTNANACAKFTMVTDANVVDSNGERPKWALKSGEKDTRGCKDDTKPVSKNDKGTKPNSDSSPSKDAKKSVISKKNKSKL